MEKNKKKYLNISAKKFFYSFLPLLLLFLMIAAVFLNSEFKSKKTILMAKEKQKVEILRRIANDDIKSVVLDLFFLSVNPLLHEMLEKKNPVIRKNVADEFKEFSSNSKLYDQIRFIDEKGMEKIRINFNRNNPGNPVIVSHDKLQNKRKRYYFVDTFALKPGRIFESPFDLNIEHGRIEQPLKPMIRFGTPVVDLKGHKRGIVLLNYFGETLIHDLEQALPDSKVSFTLLNSKGYWLKGRNPGDEWGFMYKDGKEKTLSKRYPEVWKKISRKAEGQFTSHQGIYTFATVYLLNRGMISSSGSAHPFQASKSVLSGKKDYWKLISLITNEQLDKLRTTIILKWIPYLCIGLFMILLISLLVCLIAGQQKHAAALKLKQEKMQGVLELAGAVCHECNQPLMVISGYAELLLDDTPEDAEQYKKIREIRDQTERLGTITRKLMNITQYKTKDYLRGKIIDIDEASEKE